MAPWWETELPALERRTALPHAKLKLPSVQETWKIVKHMVSSNSMDVPIPVHMCLPIDELQRRAEEMEYSELLDQAAEQAKGSIDRLLLVAAFAVSAFQAVRPMRASLPIMGETVEVVLPELRMRFLAETAYLNQKENRVINAWVAEGENWVLEGEDEPALRFWGASLELHLNWLDHLMFSDGDAYSWKKMTTGNAVIHVLGRSTVGFKGTVVIEQEGTGRSAHMAFKDSSILRGIATRKATRHEMVGHIEENGERLDRPVIHGHWDAELAAELADGSHKTLFRINPPNANRYNLPLFSLRLNEMTPGLEAKLPPTDVRRRRDLRALEQGDYAQAAAGKEVLESRWREQEREHCQRTGDTSLLPRWFELREAGGLTRPQGKAARYRYKGGYWEARASGNWQGVEDIFAQESAV